MNQIFVKFLQPISFNSLEPRSQPRYNFIADATFLRGFPSEVDWNFWSLELISRGTNVRKLRYTSKSRINQSR